MPDVVNDGFKGLDDPMLDKRKMALAVAAASRPQAVAAKGYPEGERIMRDSKDIAGTPTLCLDASLGFSAARRLTIALRSARGCDLDLNAASVGFLGAQCGQILIAAANAWRMDGRILRILDATTAFEDGVRTLGFNTYLPEAETSI